MGPTSTSGSRTQRKKVNAARRETRYGSITKREKGTNTLYLTWDSPEPGATAQVWLPINDNYVIKISGDAVKLCPKKGEKYKNTIYFRHYQDDSQAVPPETSNALDWVMRLSEETKDW